jgi:sec-independent protein translocase protein TatA
MPFNIGWMEALIFLAIALLLFGGTRLPTLMRSLGQSVTEFKRGVRDGDKDLEGPPPAQDRTT